MTSKQVSLCRQVLTLVVSTALAACGPALPLQRPAAAVPDAQFNMDVAAVVDALAKKPSTNWQDPMFRYPPLLAAKRNQHRPSYKLQAPSVVWDFNPGPAISCTPAFARADAYASGPNPAALDYLYVASNTGILYKVNPTTKAVVSSLAGLPAMANSAVVLNGANRHVYLLSTTGFFTVVDVWTMTTVYSQKISQSGFNGTAPFVDYSNGGGFPVGYDEYVYALALDGSLYRMRVQTNLSSGARTVTVNAFPAAVGTDVGSPQASWASNQSIAYGSGVTVGAGAHPVVWQGRAYFGSTAANLYKVDLNAAPAVAKWSLGKYTSAQGSGKAITAPVAVDFDNAFAVNAVFVPVGDRLIWLDPTSAANVPVASAPLALDKVPPSAAAYADTLANFPYTTASTSYTAFDWAAIHNASAPSPTRWGSGSAVAGSFSTGISCSTVKKSPLTGNMWTGHYISPNGQVSRLTPAGAVLGTHNSTVANVNEICFDTAGNCYAAHGNSDKIVKFDPSGTITQTFTMPSGYKALWPEIGTGGDLWVTSYNNNRVVKFNAAGAVVVNVARTKAYAVCTDAAGNAYVSTDESPGKVVKYNAAGTLLSTFTVGNQPRYIALEPTTQNIWTANYGSNNVSKLSPAGAVLGTYSAGANQPWSLAFDADGLPWVGCLSGDKVQKMSLTGSILATYTLTGDPYEIAFDGNGDAWVSCADGLKKLYDLGSLGDLFANTSFGTLGDGIDSYNYLKFRVPTNALANAIPVSASLQLTAATTPTTGNEDLGIFTASPNLPASGSLWIGWAGAINTNWNNRPTVSTALATLTNQTIVKDFAYSWSFKKELPIDQVNTTDATGGVWAFAHRTTSTSKVLKRVGHWYSNTSAPVAASRPTLTLSRATGATLPTTNGTRTQCTVDTDNRRVYVSGCNTVFELSYASAAAFADPAMCNYNVTASGRAAPGPLAGANYYFAPGNVLLTLNGNVVVADRNTSTNRMLLNTFTTPFDTNDKLTQSLDLNPATGTLAGMLLYDYDLGSVYATTNNNHVVRADVL